MLPTLRSANHLIVLIEESRVSPPTNCLKIVFFIKPFTGKPSFKEREANLLPHRTNAGFESIRNNTTDRPKSASLLPLKATSVQSNESIQKDYRKPTLKIFHLTGYFYL